MARQGCKLHASGIYQRRHRSPSGQSLDNQSCAWAGLRYLAHHAAASWQEESKSVWSFQRSLAATRPSSRNIGWCRWCMRVAPQGKQLPSNHVPNPVIPTWR